MKKPFIKILTLGLLGIASIFSFNSCGGGSKTTTINNDTLYNLMLGGVYSFHGFGGADEVLNKLVGAQLTTKAGESGHLDELVYIYRNYFVFPYKTNEGAGCRSTLSNDWGMNNKEEFLRDIAELLVKGHHEDYMACRKAIDENGGANADVSKIDLAKYNIDPQDGDRLEFVKAHLSEFNKAGIKSWDIARYINNINIGYCAGFVNESEAIDLMKKAAPVAKENYASWKAYYTDYDLGRRFWAGDKEHDKEFGDVVVKMQEGDNSIFKYMAFK
jgi:Protein of unknown function (DUF1266)